MRWHNRNESANVEDRRGRWSKGLPGVPIRGKAGMLLVIIVVVAGFYGIDLTPLLTGGDSATGISVSEPYTPSPEEQELARFTAVALKTTEETWRDIFHASGHVYPEPKLVLYSGATDTACGYGQSAMGPFYCPADETVYIDLSFYRDMKNYLGGGGDFAQGYVIAHEVGHHVQHVLGIDKELQRARRSGTSQKDANRLSVMMELQADCFAGVWGHVMEREGILDPGDLEQALGTAAAIGDDRLQRQRSGRIVPDSFTHGTSEQRYSWFKRGFDSGNPDECDTFGALR